MRAPDQTRVARPLAVLAVALVAVAVSIPAGGGVALSVPAPSGTAKPSRDAHVQVVAAENFWGNITMQLGGRDVSVTSLLSDPGADPHFVQTDARDAATLASAQVVVENGAGYDPWMRSLLGAGGGHPIVVDAGRVLHVSGSDPNPHLWYDVPRVPRVAAAIATALERVAPAYAKTIKKNLATFDSSLAPLESTLATIRKRFGGAPVAYTERVPGYLLARAGLDVKTPPGFARAVEDGVDPSAADTVAMRRLLSSHAVDVLLYNAQTVAPVTVQMRALARQHGVAVVPVTETMPPKERTYQRWQQTQLLQLRRALARAATP